LRHVRLKNPGLLPSAVYGLPELHREALLEAELVAVPGCYPTSAILPLAPFLREKRIETSGIVIDSKSGVSGAGRKLEAQYLFAEQDENCMAYAPGHQHAIAPEIEQEARPVGQPVRVSSCRTCCPRSRHRDQRLRCAAQHSSARAGARGARARHAKSAVRVAPPGARRASAVRQQLLRHRR
jgi:N-acetyl-gamma-glutamylphosphate reductase